MNIQTQFKFTALCIAIFALPLAQAALISKEDYQAQKTRIATEYKSAKATCASMKSNAKDVCVEQAKGIEKVSLAENEYSHTGLSSDGNKVIVAKAESAYAVAKERCDDKTGNDKDVCVKEAKATEAKALADVKMNKKIDAALKDDLQTKRDTEYKVSLEKCDALAGDAKSNCVATAKTNFGKS